MYDYEYEDSEPVGNSTVGKVEAEKFAPVEKVKVVAKAGGKSKSKVGVKVGVRKGRKSKKVVSVDAGANSSAKIITAEIREFPQVHLVTVRYSLHNDKTGSDHFSTVVIPIMPGSAPQSPENVKVLRDVVAADAKSQFNLKVRVSTINYPVPSPAPAPVPPPPSTPVTSLP